MTIMSMNVFIEALRANNLIILPTETVYGLGANALSDEAVLKIYKAKNRPTKNPLIIHVASLEEAMKYGVFNEDSLKLAKHFWLPAKTANSLTLVVPIKSGTKLSKYVTAGLDTVAIRVPNHPVALELLKQCNFPVAAPSANISTQLSPTQKAHVMLKDIPILEGGFAQVGIESTIVENTTILRPGIITKSMLETVLQKPVVISDGKVIKAPGMTKRHYAPQTPVVIDSILYDPATEARLGFGKDNQCTLNLSITGDIKEAVRNLFAYLHELDQKGYTRIHIAPLPKDQELSITLYDKLHRMIG
ncbi:MAG: threonylcarbamoyl-AMP synthase [Alphaproteobacteria bacterium]|nr:MAG: threonylcarbamoyl-AMP synthase [Alphaproteobacteria bacterium]